MTKGEYGTFDPHLKGLKLARIRMQELRAAAKTHGVPPQKVKFLGLLDGGVSPQKAIKALRKYFQTRKSDVIFTPEYLFSVYAHSDHLNTGLATLYLVKQEFPAPLPLLFTYHSFKNTHFLKCDLKSTGRALKIHKSQVQVIGYLYPLRWMNNLLNGFLHCRRLIFMEACRQIFFNRRISVSFLDRIFYSFFCLGKFIFKAWRPENSK